MSLLVIGCVLETRRKPIEELGRLIDSRGSGNPECFSVVESPGSCDHLEAALSAGFDIPDLVSDVGDAVCGDFLHPESFPYSACFAEKAALVDKIDGDAGAIEDSLYGGSAAGRKNADPIAALAQLIDDSWQAFEYSDLVRALVIGLLAASEDPGDAPEGDLELGPD